jgi:hypothetical protein
MTLTGRQLYLPIAAFELGSNSMAVQPIPLRRVGFLETHQVGRSQAMLMRGPWVAETPVGGEGLVSLWTNIWVVETSVPGFAIVEQQLANSR